ncbi:MAG: thioredoxin [Clostridia bacterium]|nr:thioredoxin [Clostridia bacterium]
MAHTVITAANFEEEVIRSDKPVLVDFWATWCGPCRMLAPVIEEISEERNDIKVCKIDVDEEPELAAEYGIQSIPTLIVFKDGQPVKKSIGVRPKDDIIAML